MTKVTNEQFFNGVRNEMKGSFKDSVPELNHETRAEILATFEEYPTLKNEFITTLTNKVAKTKLFSKAFNNPFKMLHKGELPFGKSIEELFVEQAEVKGWGEHFEGSTTEEGDLIRATNPSVKVDYISENFKRKFKASISDQQLKGAFHNESGFSDLVNNIVSQLFSTVEYQEYLDVYKILNNPTKDTTLGSTIGVGVFPSMALASETKDTAIVYLGATPTVQNIAINIKSYANRLKFPSTKYNLAGVKTFTNKEDLVLFVTPELDATLDVTLLATAFNVSLADANVRKIMVEDLGKIGTNKILCALADKDLIQMYDTNKTTQNFYNSNTLTTNIFSHHWGISAYCKFANCVVFCEGSKA